MTKREEHLAAMQTVKDQLKTAGPCHRRDLLRQLHRMEKDLKEYDRYQAMAKRGCEPLAIKTG